MPVLSPWLQHMQACLLMRALQMHLLLPLISIMRTLPRHPLSPLSLRSCLLRLRMMHCRHPLQSCQPRRLTAQGHLQLLAGSQQQGQQPAAEPTVPTPGPALASCDSPACVSQSRQDCQAFALPQCDPSELFDSWWGPQERPQAGAQPDSQDRQHRPLENPKDTW